MGVVEGFLDQQWAGWILVQLAVPVFLLAHGLPPRDRYGMRVALVAAGLLVVASLPAITGVSGLDEWQSLLAFSVVLGLLVCAVCFVFDVSVWPALYCASAGYTLQNLASGLALLVETLVMASPRRTLHGPFGVLIEVGIPALVYAVAYAVLARSLDRNGLVAVENRMMLITFLLVVVTVIGFDLIIKNLVFSGVSFLQVVLLRATHLVICAFLLFAQYEILYARRADDQRGEMERLLAERERQYQLSRQNIDAINVKCHDIRHQIRHLAERGGVVADPAALADIAREVNVYDSVVETGNRALDTILTEKGLACSSEGIVLSVIADGAALDFMEPSEIYALFGNALDNAIDAIRHVSDPERRTITLTVKRKNGMTVVNVENYCEVEPRFENGLPLTTKVDTNSHGFGMRSMRATVERYGGVLSAGVEDHVFYLNMVLDGAE